MAQKIKLAILGASGEIGQALADTTLDDFSEVIGGNLRDAFIAAIASAKSLKRIAAPEYVVAPALFLLSDDARFMTGQTLRINGRAYTP